MKVKASTVLISLVMSTAVAGITAGIVPASQVGNGQEVITEAAADAATADEQGTVSETEKSSEKETESLPDGTALLSDYAYETGDLTKDGWESVFFNLKYTPGKNVKMDVAENEKINTDYHARFGGDRYVGYNEMIASDSSNGYVQMMAEVNPNNESAEDLLDRFIQNEELELAGKTTETDIAGHTFYTRTGIKDRQRYLVGVCVDEEGIVLAMKVKYNDSDARKALLSGFEKIEETEHAESETDSFESFNDATNTDGIGLRSRYAEADTEEETEMYSESTSGYAAD